MFNGLVHLPWWSYVVIILVMTHLSIVSVTVFLHRHQTHRALDLHPLAAHFFRFWLWLTTGMVTKEWVSIHRKHHARVETDEDPHSPQILGIKKVVWWGAELYRQEYLTHPDTLENYGHGTPDDWIERHVYGCRPYLAYVGIFLLLGTYVLLFGAIGITLWAVQMAWIPFWAAGIVNGVGHWRGYRNFACPDASTNIVPWGILIGGEELHNNHHAYASSAKFSIKPWEFDIGWVYIRLLSSMGLAQVKKIADQPTLKCDKPCIDADTVKAVFTHRIHVLSEYARKVINQVHKEELNRSEGDQQALLKSLKAPLNRPDYLMNEAIQLQLDQGFEHSKPLAVVYQFKLRLQALWNDQTTPPEKVLQSLQEWCKQAEATEIRALKDFAVSLRCYSMQPA